MYTSYAQHELTSLKSNMKDYAARAHCVFAPLPYRLRTSSRQKTRGHGDPATPISTASSDMPGSGNRSGRNARALDRFTSLLRQK